jgi:hypothetical protein
MREVVQPELDAMIASIYKSDRSGGGATWMIESPIVAYAVAISTPGAAGRGGCKHRDRPDLTLNTGSGPMSKADSSPITACLLAN